ncbi:MAG: hypothetical protein LBJ46_07580, partial [Planctomycetota bacterium]|nr:hypothetical protein [Planctomycetota bacterium]
IAKLFGVTVDDLLREPEPTQTSPVPSTPAVSDIPPATGQAAGSGELVEIMNLLLQAQNEFVSGSRSADQLSDLMRDVLRYTKYVVDTTKGK